MIGSELLRYSDSQLYCVFDTETEGLSLHFSRPFELSYSICTNKEVLSSHTRYIFWNDLRMSEDAARITRFDKKAYLSVAEDAKTVWNDFAKILYDKDIKLVGHNIINYDLYLLETMRRLIGEKQDMSYVNRFIDTLSLSKAYKCGLTPDNDNFLSWQYKLCNFWPPKGVKTSLSAMCKEFNIPVDESKTHEASYDIYLNYKVFQQLLWKMEI